MKWEITLPWPDRALHPNARGHWSKRARAAKIARKAGYMSAIGAGCKGWDLPDGRLHLWIDFYPPDRRRRDDDGLIASLKPYRDGIADALGIDDVRFVTHAWINDLTVKGGCVGIRITPGPETDA